MSARNGKERQCGQENLTISGWRSIIGLNERNENLNESSGRAEGELHDLDAAGMPQSLLFRYVERHDLEAGSQSSRLRFRKLYVVVYFDEKYRTGLGKGEGAHWKST